MKVGIKWIVITVHLYIACIIKEGDIYLKTCSTSFYIYVVPES